MKRLITGAIATLAVGLSTVVLAPAASAAVNQDTVAQFIAMVNYEAERYGTGPVQVNIDYLGDDATIAGTDGYGVITLSNRYAVLTQEQFNASVTDDIADGYEPGGCNGVQAAAIHEMGHVIDRRKGMLARRTVAQAADAGQIGSDLHGYSFEDGRINPGEAVAVSFQAVECGSAKPTEQSIYNPLVS